jgi:hypothetical protein
MLSSFGDIKGMLLKPFTAMMDQIKRPLLALANPFQALGKRISTMFGGGTTSDQIKIANATKVKLLKSIVEQLKIVAKKLDKGSMGDVATKKPSFVQKMKDKVLSTFAPAKEKEQQIANDVATKKPSFVQKMKTEVGHIVGALKDTHQQMTSKTKEKEFEPLKRDSKGRFLKKGTVNPAIETVTNDAPQKRTFGERMKTELKAPFLAFKDTFMSGKNNGKDEVNPEKGAGLQNKLLKSMLSELKKITEKLGGKAETKKPVGEASDEDTGANGLLKVLKKAFSKFGDEILGFFKKWGVAIVGALSAAFAGFQIGKLIDEYVVDPFVKWITGDATQTLGGAICDFIQGVQDKVASWWPEWLPKPDWAKSGKAHAEATKNVTSSASAEPKKATATTTPSTPTATLAAPDKQPAALPEKSSEVSKLKDNAQANAVGAAVGQQAQQSAPVISTNTTNNSAVLSMRSLVRNNESSMDAWKKRVA